MMIVLTNIDFKGHLLAEVASFLGVLSAAFPDNVIDVVFKFAKLV